jgi:flagellar protein FlbD
VIEVTRLDGTTVLINIDQIESIERTPDTIVSLANGHKIVVRESPTALVERIVAFKRAVERPKPLRLLDASSDSIQTRGGR